MVRDGAEQGVQGFTGTWRPLPDNAILAPTAGAATPQCTGYSHSTGDGRRPHTGSQRMADSQSGRDDFILRSLPTDSSNVCEGDPYPERHDPFRRLSLRDLEVTPSSARHALQKEGVSELTLQGLPVPSCSASQTELLDRFGGDAFHNSPKACCNSLSAKNVGDDTFACQRRSEWDVQKFPSGVEGARSAQAAYQVRAAETDVVDDDAGSRLQLTARMHGPGGHAPPLIPDDEHVQLASSTFRVSKCRPDAILQELFEFFTNWLENAWVEKQNQRKFTTKAVACVDGFKCSLKVRTYTENDCTKEGLPVYAIEFQRREGNGLAFLKVYAAAESHVKLRLQNVGADGAAPQPEKPHRGETVDHKCPGGAVHIVPPLPACNGLAGEGKQVLQAVLDVAHLHDSPQSQVEAIGRLLSQALESEYALQSLASERVMEAIIALAQSEDTTVNLLTARWLSFLVHSPQTDRRLASLTFMPVIDRFRSNAKNPAAQKILCQVLKVVRVADGRAIFQP